MRQEVTLMVHDDGPVGLEGVQVRFNDERVVSDAGSCWPRRWRRGWGSRRSSGASCGLRGDRPGDDHDGKSGGPRFEYAAIVGYSGSQRIDAKAAAHRPALQSRELTREPR